MKPNVVFSYRCIQFISLFLWVLTAGLGAAASDASVLALAQREKAGLLSTLSDLVGIESGSRDLEGLERVAALISDRLQALGAAVDTIPVGAGL